MRLRADLQPRTWLRFRVEAQDTRAAVWAGEEADRPSDPFDLHLGYAELGRGEEGWRVRAGRQELPVADERLIGVDREWDPFGQAFDAVSCAFIRGGVHTEAFAGYLVRPGEARPNGFDTATRIAGLSVNWTSRAGRRFHPFLFWKRGGETRDLMDRGGHRDIVTPGLAASGDLPANLDYNLEMAVQGGHVAGDSVAAWAGHWEGGWKPLGREFGLRLSAEYNYASGDANPGDGRHGSFDDLYPADYNRGGLRDPFAWRNIRYLAASVEVPASRRWSLSGGYRAYWLANVRDGVYPGGDEYVTRNPGAGSAFLGRYALVAASYEHSTRWRLGGGFGRMFRGGYWREAGPAGSAAKVYLQAGFRY